MAVTPFTLPATLAPHLPFAPGAAREILRSNPDFLTMVGDDPSLVTTRELPNPLTRPAVTIGSHVNRRENIESSRVRILLSVWVPKIEILVDGIDGAPPKPMDPEELAWNIAAFAGQILDQRRMMGRGPSFNYRGANWRGTWEEGPTTMVDTARGPENPIYRAVIQVVMNIGSA